MSSEAPALREKSDIENVAPVLFFLRSQKIEKQGCQPRLPQALRDVRVAWTESAATAAMSENYDAAGASSEAEQRFQSKRADLHGHLVVQPVHKQIVVALWHLTFRMDTFLASQRGLVDHADGTLQQRRRQRFRELGILSRPPFGQRARLSSFTECRRSLTELWYKNAIIQCIDVSAFFTEPVANHLITTSTYGMMIRRKAM